MAPPDKEIMGVRMHIPTDPPEDGPPNVMPRRRQPTKPQVEAEPEYETDVALASTKPPFSRKDSPAGGIRFEGKGWRITMPHVALVAVLTTLGGWFGSRAVSHSEEGDRADMLAELRSIREEIKGTRADIRDIRDEQQQQRGSNKKILNYVEDSLTPIVASLRKLGVKLEFRGADPAQDVEFQPAPLPGSKAPPIQPRATLPDRPNL